MGSVVLYALCALLLFGAHLVWKWFGLRRAVARYDGWPSQFDLFSQYSLLGILIRTIDGYHKGRDYLFVSKHKDYRRMGWNAIVESSLLPTGTHISVADADMLKEILNTRVKYPKPVEEYGMLAFFGKNIVITEGDEWKKHRKISSPAFSDRNNRLVWDSTVNVMEELFSDVWSDDQPNVVDHCLDVTTQIALMVLSVAGYGQPMHWKGDSVVPPGHSMTFTDAVTTVTAGLVMKLAFPDWMLRLRKKTRKIRNAFRELEMYMSEMIDERRLLLEKETRWDLLSNLIRASEDEDTGESKLTRSELMGNIFIYLVAGHETTAHALCYVFGLLALYPDEQEKLFQHIKEAIGDRRPVYEDYMKLHRVLACFYEALRLYPVVTGIPKSAAEDSALKVTRADPKDDRTGILKVPKGTVFTMQIPAVHYNPRYWEDPYEFKPERFLGDWNRDAFVVFSGGPRACIGRRFSESEAVAVITMIISRYTVTVKEDPQTSSLGDETVAERRERLLKSDILLTLTPDRVPLVFTRRP